MNIEMNKFKFLILPFLFGFVLFSCSDSKSEEGGEVPPTDNTYTIPVDVWLFAKYSSVNEGSGETIIDVDHTIADAQTLIYVVHEKTTGKFSGMHKLDGEEFKKLVADDQFTYKLSLEEGEYYLSVVAMMDTKLTATNTANFLKPMTQDYKDAVAQVPNDYIYYRTTEIEVVPNATEQNKKVAMSLNRMTTDIVYEFVDAYKVPTEGEYTFQIGVNEIPAAFYLSTGKTLTDKEVKSQKLNKYTAVHTLPVPTTKTKELVATFHALRNGHLENTAAERGEYWFEFSQMVEKGSEMEKEKKVLKTDKRVLDEYEESAYFYLTINDLYTAKESTIVTK